ncbi:MAG: hypothetical protein WBG46_14745 [Nonlabens sp.]
MKTSLLFLSMLFCFLISAQNNPEFYINRFFQELKDDGFESAVDHIYGTNPWALDKKEALDQLKSQFAGFQVALGEYYGEELIVKKALGKSLVHFSYIAKYDLQPMRFQFQFYKPKDKWKLLSFSYDETFDDELEESAQVKFLTH